MDPRGRTDRLIFFVTPAFAGDQSDICLKGFIAGLIRGAQGGGQNGCRIKSGMTMIQRLLVNNIHSVQPASASKVPKVATTPTCRPSGALPACAGV